MTLEEVFGLYNYWVVICLMMTGFYIVIARKNMIKTVIGLNIFQISVFLLYITMGKITGGTAPILQGHDEAHAETHVETAIDGAVAVVDVHAGETSGVVGQELAHDVAHEVTEQIYTHPLPSVLMLTAIVVGVATTAVALALIIRISEAYGTIEEDEILQQDRDAS